MSGRARLTLAAAIATFLASLSLWQTVATGAWVAPAFVGIVAVAGSCALGRRLRLPRLLVPLVGLCGLSCWTSLTFAHSEATLGVLPDPSVLPVLSRLADEGRTVINTYAAPVPDRPGLVMLAAVGVAVVALVVDTLAVTYRRVPLAGLALLSLYVVPATVVADGLHAWFFALGGSGFVALLVADSHDRLGRWGRAFVSSGTAERHHLDEVSTRPVTVIGRRIGAAALGVAVVIPALVPGLGEGVFGQRGSGSGVNGQGGNTISTSNPIVSLRRTLRAPEALSLLTYRSDDLAPDYFRTATLDIFDGVEWRQSPGLNLRNDQQVADGLPPPPGLTGEVTRHEVHTVVQATDGFTAIYLPVPYPATKIQIAGDWRYDLDLRNVLSADSDVTTAGQSWSATSLHLDPTPNQLRQAGVPQAGLERYLQLPQDLPLRLGDLARRVTRDAGNDFDAAVDLQRWFNNPRQFTYDLRVRAGTGTSALLDFLRDRTGYCEQFAATMAVMARALGIPARVDVGYTAGTRQPDGSYLVTTQDSHAWPELYFAGSGWLRFEPTPPSDEPGGRGTTPSYTDARLTGPGGGAAGSLGPTDASSARDPNQRARALAQRLEGNQGPRFGTGGPLPGRTTQHDLPLLPVTLGVLLVLAAVFPSAARFTVRQSRRRRARRPELRARIAWRELRDDALDLGYLWTRSQTPRHAARSLIHDAQLGDEARAALERLTTANERLRYAPARDEQPSGELMSDVATVRRALAAAKSRRARAQALLLPASTRVLLTRSSGWVADALDWVDRVGSRLRLRLRRA